MPTAEQLLQVIELQAEVAELGLDFSGVTALVTAKVLGLVSADGAAIELIEDGALVYHATSGMASQRRGARVELGASLSGLCMRRGEALSCLDSEADPRVDLVACRAVGLRSMVVVPLVHEGVAVGVLKALAMTPGRFGEDDVALLALLSRAVGAAMHWARRYDQDALFQRATHDELTGLANRSLFTDRLHHALFQARRQGLTVTVALLDMDGLKTINDALGHAAGDLALIEFARRLRQTARLSDTVARMGGDEFGLVLSSPLPTRDATGLMNRLGILLGEPFPINGEPQSIAASCGCSVFPGDAEEPRALLNLADLRMYEAKRQRKQDSLRMGLTN